MTAVLPRRRNLTEQAATTAIDTAWRLLRLLRLPPIRNEFADIADRAVKDQMTYRGLLAELLMAECDDRGRRRSERRIKAAGFPRDKSLELSGVVRASTGMCPGQSAADAVSSDRPCRLGHVLPLGRVRCG
ncbi:ATP-binding protein, partial [Kitasatospora phosalacinea]|uniref:ATP-binding protein n=1 Tax=Kitasatospora phosalacinea TaxID=2065 RepID=UPI0025561FDA